MKKICAIVVSLVAAAIIGCYEGGEVVCGDKTVLGDIDYESTSDFDSIRIYLGNQRICYGDVGGDVRSFSCKTSADSDYEYFNIESGGIWKDYRIDKIGRDKCIELEEYPLWNRFGCTYNSLRDGIDMATTDLTIEIFHNGKMEKKVVKDFVPGGFMNYFVSASDSALYFGVDRKENPNKKMDWSLWTREGCFDDLCLLRMPIPERDEYCVEK